MHDVLAFVFRKSDLLCDLRKAKVYYLNGTREVLTVDLNQYKLDFNQLDNYINSMNRTRILRTLNEYQH